MVEAEILRTGNENILDSLEEGLIILDQNKKDNGYENKVLYLNKAAKILNVES